MNKYLRLVLWNSFFVIIAILCIKFPEYLWVFKIMCYVILPIGFLGKVYCLAKPEETPKEFKENNEGFYLLIDYSYDLLFLFLLVIMDLRFIFGFYIVSLFFTVSLRHKLKELARQDGGL